MILSRIGLGVSCVLLPLVARASGQVNVTVHNAAKAWQGYTTEITDVVPASPALNPHFRVFDMHGNVVRTWVDPLPGWGFAEVVKPLAFGNILAMVYDRNAPAATPRRKKVVELDWNGNVVWQFDGGSTYHPHHDCERLPGGNTLILANRQVNQPLIHPSPIWDDVILEVDSAGSIVWMWSAVDHAAQLPLTPEQWSFIFRTPNRFIFHANSVAKLPPNKFAPTDPRFDDSNLILSLRQNNLVVIIERPSGRVVWSYTKAIGQHHVRMIPKGMPGAGNILIYDNGGPWGTPPAYRGYTKVVEVHPQTKQIKWSYDCRNGPFEIGTEGTPRDIAVCRGDTFRQWLTGGQFFSWFMGSAQRLPNGNTLINEGVAGHVFEVTRHGEIVWEYFSPPGIRVYRSYRVDANWQALFFVSFFW